MPTIPIAADTAGGYSATQMIWEGLMKNCKDLTVMVVGAGTMGLSMAQVMAAHGIKTYMTSRHEWTWYWRRWWRTPTPSGPSTSS